MEANTNPFANPFAVDDEIPKTSQNSNTGSLFPSQNARAQKPSFDSLFGD